MSSRKISQEDMIRYKYLFGYRIQLIEANERNRKIFQEIDDITRNSKNLKSSNLAEFKIAKVLNKTKKYLINKQFI